MTMYQKIKDFMKVNEEKGEFLLFTNNLRLYKGNPVLVVGNNKLVFVGNLCIEKGLVDGINCFAIRMCPDFFRKVYTFKNDFEDFNFTAEDSWESLKEVSKQQEESANKRECTYEIYGKIKLFHLDRAIKSL